MKLLSEFLGLLSRTLIAVMVCCMCKELKWTVAFWVMAALTFTYLVDWAWLIYKATGRAEAA